MALTVIAHERKSNLVGSLWRSLRADAMAAVDSAAAQPALLRRHDTCHEDGVWSVAWTSAGKLVSGSVDETVKVGGGV